MKAKVYQKGLVLAGLKAPAEPQEGVPVRRLAEQGEQAVHLPIKVPAEQAVNLRIKEQEVRELLPHLTREQTEGHPQVLHQGKEKQEKQEKQEEGGVPLMVLRSHRERVEEADQ